MMLNVEMTPMAVGHPHRSRSVPAWLQRLVPHQQAPTREEQILRYEVLRDREEREYRATMLASRIV
jgi:hypothetical protein